MRFVVLFWLIIWGLVGSVSAQDLTYILSPSMALSADGSMIAVTGRYIEDVSARHGFRYPIDFYDTQTGELIDSHMGSEDSISGLSFNADGSSMIYSNDNGELAIVNLMALNQPLVLVPGGFVEIRYPIWDPTGSEIAIAMGAGLRFYDAPQSNSVRDEYNSGILGLDWSNDGTTIVYTKHVDDTSNGILFVVQVNDPFEPTIVKEIPVTSSSVIALNPLGDIAATVTQAGLILTNLDDESQRLLSDDGLTIGITSLAWNPDGNRIAAGANELIVVWDMETGDIIETTEVDHVAYDVVWSPDGQHLYYAAEPRGVYRDGLPLWQSLALDIEN